MVCKNANNFTKCYDLTGVKLDTNLNYLNLVEFNNIDVYGTITA